MTEPIAALVLLVYELQQTYERNQYVVGGKKYNAILKALLTFDLSTVEIDWRSDPEERRQYKQAILARGPYTEERDGGGAIEGAA